MTISIFDSIFGRFLRKRPGLEKMVSDISSELAARQICKNTRKQLSNLTEAQLRDIGITKAQADKESNRGFWD